MTFKKSRIKELVAMTEKEINANCKDFTEKDWYAISWKRKKMSANFLKKHADKLYWPWVCEYCKMDTKTLRKLVKYFDNKAWYYVSRYQKLDEEFINDFNDKLDWKVVSQKQKMNMSMIRENADNLNWREVCGKRKLTEDFMEEHINKLQWSEVTDHQRMSDKFIIKHKDKIKWDNPNLFKHNKISTETLKQCFEYVDLDALFTGAWRKHDKMKTYGEYRKFVINYCKGHFDDRMNKSQIVDYILHFKVDEKITDRYSHLLSHYDWKKICDRDYSKAFKKKYADEIKSAQTSNMYDYWD